MLIRCPLCEYVRDVTNDKVPPKAEFASCPKCRHRFRFRALDSGGDEEENPAAGPEMEAKHGDIWDAVDSLTGRWNGKGADNAGRDNAQDADDADKPEEKDKRPIRDLGRLDEDSEEPRVARRAWSVPWEQPRVMGFVPSLIRTMVLALLQPSRFFAYVTADPPLTPAMLFYVIFGVLQYVFDLLWSNMVVRLAGPELLAALPGPMQQMLDFSRLPIILVTAPFLLALQLFITAALLHLMLRVLEPAEANFPKAFKVAAYASAALILTVVPLLGPLLGPIWYLALLLLGCRHAFRLNWAKTMLVMAPLYLLMLFAVVSQYGPLLSR